MPGVIGLLALAIGLACTLADHQISHAVWRQTEDPESGAASMRMLGLILFVAGGLALLTWAP